MLIEFFHDESLIRSDILLFMIDFNEVDPECGLAKKAHIYCKTLAGDYIIPYSVVLGLVDIECNKNSYYRMQLLESNRLRT